MPDLIIHKEVSALPPVLTPDTLYFVRVGSGFDIWLTDSIANTAHTLNGPPVATLADYLASSPGKVLAPGSVFGGLVPLTDAPTVAVDLATGYDFGGAGDAPLAIGGNRTLGAPANGRSNLRGALYFTAGATRTLTLHPAWVLARGVEVGPYEIGAGEVLGVHYFCRGARTVVCGITWEDA